MCDNNVFMGLFNKPCENPKYFCKSHAVYLNDDDVERKHCLCKPTFDMISTRKCTNLVPIDKWKADIASHKERYQKVKDSRANNGWHVY